MNESETGSASEQDAAYEFPSLSVLKAAHLKLLHLESDAASPDGTDSAFLDEVRDFMLRASATGRILEDDKERGIAQTLLNYWVTVLVRAGVRDDAIPSSSLADLDESAGRDLDESQCPYRGLDAYSEDTAHLFFGRKHVVAKWLEILGGTKSVLVVLGPSGSGKTSLIRAGLLPALRAGGVPGSESWKVTEATLHDVESAEQLFTSLETRAGKEPELLVIHRLDEGLLSCERKTQHKLIAALKKWLIEPAAKRKAVLVGRIESAALVTQWLREGNLTEESKQDFIPPFEARELRAVIELPAEGIGLRFDEGLIDTLINQFLGDPAALALLQFTLIKLWDKRERNRITWAAYHEIGGGGRVVETAAEAIYDATDFNEQDREITQKIFLRLAVPGLTRALVVNRVSETKLAPAPGFEERTKKIVERFEKARLLRARTDAHGERFIEVAHEALLRKWPRLLQWLEDARLELLQRQRIAVAAAQWREKGRHRSALWTGILLTAALLIQDQLSPSELEFVQASKNAVSRRRLRIRLLLAAVIGLLAVLSLLFRYERGATEAALNIECGKRKLESRDPAGAFLFFHEAATGDPVANMGLWYRFWRVSIFKSFPWSGQALAKNELHQVRLGVTWRQLPRIEQLLFLKDLTHTELSPSGEYLAGMSDTELRIWRLGADGGTQERDPLKDHPHGQVMWASFHPDPALPLIAIAMTDRDSAGKPAECGEVFVVDARSNQPVGKPIPFADDVPQKVWFGRGKGGDDLLLIVHRPSGTLVGSVSIWNFRTVTREAGPAPTKPEDPLPVNWAAFSPDGELVVTAAGDLNGGGESKGAAMVWAWKQGHKTYLEHPGPIVYAEFDDEGGRVLTAEGTNEGDRGAARVWSVSRLKADPFLQTEAITEPLIHRGAVTRARFSPDGLWVATSSRDRTARLWHVPTQKEVLNLEHSSDVNDVVFSPDGRYLATAGRDGSARIWEVATGQPVQPPLNHSETVSEIAYSRDGRSIVTSSKHLARLWAAEREEAKAPLLQAKDAILARVSGDGQRVLTVTAKEDQSSSLELSDTGTGEIIASQEFPNEQIRLAELNSDGSRVAIGSGDSSGSNRMIRIMQLSPGEGRPGSKRRFEETASFESAPGSDVLFAAFGGDHERIALLLRKMRKKGEKEKDTRVAICEVGKKEVRILPGQEGKSYVSRVQFSPSGKYLLACYTQPPEPKGCARLWALDWGPTAPSELYHKTEITTVAFSPDETRLLSGSTDNDARLWMIADGRVTGGEVLRARDENTHTDALTYVCFSPDGKHALTAAKDQTATLWDLPRARLLERFLHPFQRGFRRIAVLPHSAYVNHATFSGEGELILTSSGEPKLRIWSAATGEPLADFNPTGEVLRAGFARDRKSIFAIGQNFANRSGPSASDEEPDNEALLREIRPVKWEFVPPELGLAHLRDVGTLVAARFPLTIDRRTTIEKAEAEKLSEIWKKEASTYQALFPPKVAPGDFHLWAADECERKKQWFAAAWHLTQFLSLEKDSPSRAALLLRQARAYQEANTEAQLAPGKASGNTIDALRNAVRLNPSNSDLSIQLGEALAGKRDFAEAEIQFQHALELGNSSARARLALVNWLKGEQGKQQYRDLCKTLTDSAGSDSLLWPSVLTDAFEKDKDFRETIVDRARKRVEAAATNFHNRDTLGAALYRASHYGEAITELEKARADWLAEREKALSQHDDHVIRAPTVSTLEGRPENLVFLAMANARANRPAEASVWMRKLRNAPELAQSVRAMDRKEPRNFPVSYNTLALELLYEEAFNLLRSLPASTGR